MGFHQRGIDGNLFQQFDSTGAPSGAETAANTPGVSVQSNPAVAIRSDGIFGAAWVDTTASVTNTVARYYLPNGTAITDPVILSDQGQIGTRTAYQFLPSGVTIEAYTTGVTSTARTDLETLSPSLTVQGLDGVFNTITADFNDVNLTVNDNGTQSIVLLPFSRTSKSTAATRATTSMSPARQLLLRAN